MNPLGYPVAVSAVTFTFRVTLPRKPGAEALLFLQAVFIFLLCTLRNVWYLDTWKREKSECHVRFTVYQLAGTLRPGLATSGK